MIFVTSVVCKFVFISSVLKFWEISVMTSMLDIILSGIATFNFWASVFFGILPSGLHLLPI